MGLLAIPSYKARLTFPNTSGGIRFHERHCQACGAGGGLHKYLNSHKIVPQKQIQNHQYQKKHTKKTKTNKKQQFSWTPGKSLSSSKSARKLFCLVWVFFVCLVLLFVFFGIGFLCFVILVVLLELGFAAALVQSAPLRHNLESFIL